MGEDVTEEVVTNQSSLSRFEHEAYEGGYNLGVRGESLPEAIPYEQGSPEYDALIRGHNAGREASPNKSMLSSRSYSEQLAESGSLSDELDYGKRLQSIEQRERDLAEREESLAKQSRALAIDADSIARGDVGTAGIDVRNKTGPQIIAAKLFTGRPITSQEGFEIARCLAVLLLFAKSGQDMRTSLASAYSTNDIGREYLTKARQWVARWTTSHSSDGFDYSEVCESWDTMLSRVNGQSPEEVIATLIAWCDEFLGL